MKLLFDENLSPQLGRLLSDLFPHSVHVRDVGLKAADDPAVWKYAQDNSLIICSKDSDMHQRSFLMGYPPKVVWCDWAIALRLTWRSYCENTLPQLKCLPKMTTRRFSLCHNANTALGQSEGQRI